MTMNLEPSGGRNDPPAPALVVGFPPLFVMMHMHQWFRTIWQKRAKQLLLAKNSAITPYLNQTLIREWLDYRGQVWSRYGVLLWLLVSLELWLQVNQKE